MDVLTVGGKEYVKASTIARELGYTADYVGQLCRSGKVNARLVGRSWYVDGSSIQTHKNAKRRSSQAKSIQHLRTTLEQNTESVLEAPSHFYAHNKAARKASYENDDAELIPTVSKTKLAVELADAKRVSIEEKAERYHFETPELPEIKFKGTLRVTDYEPEEEENVESTSTDEKGVTHIHPKLAKTEKSNKATNIAISASRTSTFATKIAREEQIRAQDHSTDQVSKVSQTVASEVVVEETTLNMWVISSGVMLGIAFVLLAFGLESQTLVQNQDVVTTYSFGVENLNLAASLHQAFEPYEGLINLASFSKNLFTF